MDIQRRATQTLLQIDTYVATPVFSLFDVFATQKKDCYVTD